MIRHMTHTPRCPLRRTATEPRLIDGWIETGYAADEMPDGTEAVTAQYKHAVRKANGKAEEQWWWLVQEDWEKPTLNAEGDEE